MLDSLNPANRWLATCVLLVALFESSPASAFVEVGQHKMRCSKAFPCPEELQDRVNFWIDIYSRWDSQDAVLHDSVVPSRVYRVIEGRACGRKGNTEFIKDQKKRIASELHTLANKVDRKSPVSSAYQKHLLKLFPDRSSADIRRAAGDIRCQSGNRDGFTAALRRFGTYGPMVRRVLKDSGLHSDIQYLPFVESSYSPKAYSRVGAAGLWQIMPATGRTLGLELDATVDERLDPEAASWAAARYLKDARKTLTVAARAKNSRVSHSELSPFVITSYNYGVNGMRRAIKKMGPDYMRVINQYRSKKFQVAVKNFYAGFLAARHVTRNHKRFFGDIKPGRPLQYQTLILDRPVSVARLQSVFGLTETQLKTLNPALTRFVWHGWRFIPDGYKLRLPKRQDGWSNHVARLRMMPSERRQGGSVEYTVRTGDTACGIAAAFRVDCRELIAINDLNRKAVIRVGQKLQVPAKRRSRSRVAQRGRYEVQPGDSACVVAGRFGVDCDDLLAANGLHRGSVLQVGASLVIPGTMPTAPGGSYTVGKGDSACSIASRYGISCGTLLSANRLVESDLIFPGQTLTVPGVAAPSSAADRASPQDPAKTLTYTVVSGDSACRIAVRFQVPCRRLIADNALGKEALIVPGQSLTITEVPANLARSYSPSAQATKTAASLADTKSSTDETWSKIADIAGSGSGIGLSGVSPLDRPIDLSVQASTADGRTLYRINVEPEETLGHYSDWLRLGGVEKIRELNGYDATQVLESGDALLLPVADETQRDTFERRREEYHRVLVEEFKENFEVTGADKYKIRSGDSLWVLAREFELPIWVITRYNPELRKGPPRAGKTIKIPRIRSRQG
ncbi:MAG TPA: hypothetical protein DHW07_05405 [Gammaproteobacteria bacterium]|nr:hypothetical protein [Gammaproteobacteria bacterium]